MPGHTHGVPHAWAGLHIRNTAGARLPFKPPSRSTNGEGAGRSTTSTTSTHSMTTRRGGRGADAASNAVLTNTSVNDEDEDEDDDGDEEMGEEDEDEDEDEEEEGKEKEKEEEDEDEDEDEEEEEDDVVSGDDGEEDEYEDEDSGEDESEEDEEPVSRKRRCLERVEADESDVDQDNNTQDADTEALGKDLAEAAEEFLAGQDRLEDTDYYPSDFEELVKLMAEKLLCYVARRVKTGVEDLEKVGVDKITAWVVDALSEHAPGAVDYLDKCVQERRPWKTEDLTEFLPDVEDEEIEDSHGIYLILFRLMAKKAAKPEPALYGYGGSVYGFGRNLVIRMAEHFNDNYQKGQSGKHLYKTMRRKGFKMVDVKKKALLPKPKRWIAKFGQLSMFFLETLSIALFLGWDQTGKSQNQRNWFPKAVVDAWFPDGCVEGMHEAFGITPTNGSIPVGETSKGMDVLGRLAYSSLRDGEATTDVLVSKVDGITKFFTEGRDPNTPRPEFVVAHSQAFGISWDILEKMWNLGYRPKAPRLQLHLTKSDKFEPENFAQVDQSFVDSNFPDAGSILLEAFFEDSTVSPPGRSSVFLRLERTRNVVLKRAMKATTMWEWTTGQLPPANGKFDTTRYDFHRSDSKQGPKVYDADVKRKKTQTRQEQHKATQANGKKLRCLKAGCKFDSYEPGSLYGHLGLASLGKTYRNIPKEQWRKRMRACREPWAKEAGVEPDDLTGTHVAELADLTSQAKARAHRMFVRYP